MYSNMHRIQVKLWRRFKFTPLFIGFSIIISIWAIQKFATTLLKSQEKVSGPKRIPMTFDSSENINKNQSYQIQWAPHTPPVLDFLIRTWHRDGHWLIYLLRSIERFVPRALYRHIIVTFSAEDTDYFQSFLLFFPLSIRLIPVKDISIRNGPNNGSYYSQMFSKFYAHQYSDADFFIHMDSDTLFKEPVLRFDFLDEQNRVYVKRVRFDSLEKRFRTYQKSTEDLLLESIPYETMNGFPYVYPRDLYPKMINAIEKRHNKPFREVIKSTKNFAEFTTLGHYLITQMSRTRWIENESKSNKIIQFKSRQDVGPNEAAWFECILRAQHYSMCSTKSFISSFGISAYEKSTNFIWILIIMINIYKTFSINF